MNTAFLRATGLSDAQVLGRSLCDLFTTDSGVGTLRVRESIDRALETRAPDVISGVKSAEAFGAFGVRADDRAWAITHTPAAGADGDIMTIVQTLQDVSAVAVATAARDEAQRTSQLKTRFLGMISHELRTPLTALCLQVERMQRNGADLGHRHQESLERIAFSAARLREMIETLLEYARIEGGHIVVNSARFDLGESVRQTVEYHRIDAEHRGLDLRCSAPESSTFVQTDRRLVELVISNLVENAIKFTSAGRVAVQLGRSSEGVHRVAVSDSGPGIPEAQQQRIFEPFEQLDALSPKQRPAGVGLGLALVRDIAGALGGHIELVSRPREGSTFTFVLPAPGPPPPGPPPESVKG